MLYASQSFFVYRIQSKDIFFYRKTAFEGKWGVEVWIKNKKMALATVIKNSTTSIRKYANDLKAHEKTVRTAIRKDLSPDLNPLDFSIWGVLENKTNATFSSKYWFAWDYYWGGTK